MSANFIFFQWIFWPWLNWMVLPIVGVRTQKISIIVVDPLLFTSHSSLQSHPNHHSQQWMQLLSWFKGYTWPLIERASWMSQQSWIVMINGIFFLLGGWGLGGGGWSGVDFGWCFLSVCWLIQWSENLFFFFFPFPGPPFCILAYVS